ncbi:unnamed protein product [Adineta steineri]|uniref:F-box domain-containing protein n=1 Tax=Adineta steineri TaxID=433720 RepID=A0A819PIS9_9BILA|nr:unnamed protein product [Adineta steineri]CAF4010216.1 unnamed protein product [Adineta steineri]
MKFEFLPNEVLLQCFQYLNAPDIFYSFDQLNSHFSTLIRNVPLYLNFCQMKKSLFNHFSQTILLNPEIKQKIIYLQLSNDGTPGQIEHFLSLFSLNKFLNLRSLSLINLKKNNTKQLLSILPFLSNLYSFSFTGTNNEILEIIPKSKLRILTVPHLEFKSTSVNQTITGVTSLTITESKFDNFNLFKLFECAPMLKYLNIQTVENSEMNKYNESKKNANYLKELIINNCKATFENLELLLKYTPNLKIFSIFIANNMNMFDAIRWQNLIETSLKHLSVFKFHFQDKKFDKPMQKLNKFQPFQNDFWHKQHQWFTNLEIYTRTSTIYTIPYEKDNYELTCNTDKHGYLWMKNSNVFDNVKTLTLTPRLIAKNSKCYFRNVDSLILTRHSDENYDEDDDDDDDDDDDKPDLKSTEIKLLHTIVNLSNIKHLTIDEEFYLTPSLLLDLLKELPNVSSIKIDEEQLKKIFKNIELCKYLNKNIKKLDISTGECLDERIFLNKIKIVFSQIFSNIEQFTCGYMKQVDDLLVILKECSNLSIVKCEVISKPVNSWIQINASKLDVYLDFKSVNEETDDEEYNDDDDDEYDYDDDEE